jgi:hypothetical protein
MLGIAKTMKATSWLCSVGWVKDEARLPSPAFFGQDVATARHETYLPLPIAMFLPPATFSA